MKQIRFIILITVSIVLCGASSMQSVAAEPARNWIDSPLYHREIPKPRDAEGCVQEQWVVKGDPRLDFHGKSTLSIPVCAYYADGFSYGIYQRDFTSIGLTNWMSEGKLAVKKEGDEVAIPVSNLNYNYVMPLANLGKSKSLALLGSSPGRFLRTSLTVIEEFLSKLSIDSASGYYSLSSDELRSSYLNQDGSVMVVNGFGASRNGKWLALIANGQLLRVNLATGDRDVVMYHNFDASYLWPEPRHSTFISDDGNVVGFIGQTVDSLVVQVSSDCLNSSSRPLSYNDQAYYTRCKYRTINNDLDANSSYVFGYQHYNNASLLGGSVLQYSDAYSRWHQISYENFTGQKYLALGDSYASGEGDVDVFLNRNYVDGTDILGDYKNGIPRENCHQSLNAYPYLLGAQAGLQRRFGMDSVACSGAVKINIARQVADKKVYSEYENGIYMGQLTQRDGGLKPRLQGIANAAELNKQAMDNLLPGRVQQIEQLKAQQPYVATIQISGNDLGFGQILSSCILNWARGAERIVGAKQEDCDWINPEFKSKVASAVMNNRDDLVGLYRQLHEASPTTQLYAVGYPLFIKQTAVCWNTASLSAAEQEFIVNVIKLVNATIKSAASEAGIRYIDIEDALGDQVICGKSGAMTDLFDAVSGAMMADMKRGMEVDRIAKKYDIKDPTEYLLLTILYRNAATTGDTATFMAHPLLNLASTMQQLFHPNAEGHRLIAQKITNSFESHSILDAECDETVIYCPSSKNTAKPSVPEYFGPLPTITGAIVEIGTIAYPPDSPYIAGKVISAGSDAITIIKRGYKIIVRLAPRVSLSSSKLSVAIHSDTLRLGDLAEISEGVYEGQMSIPNDFAVGMHTIEVSGTTPDGMPYSALSAVAVIGDDNDEDADGIPDTDDKCLYRDACMEPIGTVAVDASANSPKDSRSTSLINVNQIAPSSLPILNDIDKSEPILVGGLRSPVSGAESANIAVDEPSSSSKQKKGVDFFYGLLNIVPVVILVIILFLFQRKRRVAAEEPGEAVRKSRPSR